MDSNSLLQEELETLQAIYMDDLAVSEMTNSEVELQITLHPNTADELDKKNVCLTIICSITALYPDLVPKIVMKNPRGLSDAHLVSIEDNLKGLAMSKVGDVMLFDLLEYAKDSLTDNNHPSCICPICLEHFQESETFFRTDCYHYFHLPCIMGYIRNFTNTQYVCPVCRFAIVVQDDLLKRSLSYVATDTKCENIFQEFTFIPSKKYLEWRKDCNKLFRKQQQKGGIIDLEYEKNKYLVTAETCSLGTNEQTNEQAVNPKLSAHHDINDTKDQAKFHTNPNSVGCTCIMDDDVKSKKRHCRYCSKQTFASDDKRWRKKKPVQQNKQSTSSRFNSDGIKQKTTATQHKTKKVMKCSAVKHDDEIEVDAASCNPPSVRKKTTTSSHKQMSEKPKKQEFCKRPPPGFENHESVVNLPGVKIKSKLTPLPGF